MCVYVLVLELEQCFFVTLLIRHTFEYSDDTSTRIPRESLLPTLFVSRHANATKWQRETSHLMMIIRVSNDILPERDCHFVSFSLLDSICFRQWRQCRCDVFSWKETYREMYMLYIASLESDCVFGRQTLRKVMCMKLSCGKMTRGEISERFDTGNRCTEVNVSSLSLYFSLKAAFWKSLRCFSCYFSLLSVSVI